MLVCLVTGEKSEKFESKSSEKYLMKKDTRKIKL